jgi:hypothetical protein
MVLMFLNQRSLFHGAGTLYMTGMFLRQHLHSLPAVTQAMALFSFLCPVHNVTSSFQWSSPE